MRSENKKGDLIALLSSGEISGEGLRVQRKEKSTKNRRPRESDKV